MAWNKSVTRMHKGNNILILMLCAAITESGCQTAPKPRFITASSDVHADKVEFLRVARKPRSSEWLFRIKNGTPVAIKLEKMMGSDDRPFEPPSDSWQSFKDGKWKDIQISGDAPHYPYFLKPGKCVEFSQELPWHVLRLPRHTLIRLKNGVYYSEPFER